MGKCMEQNLYLLYTNKLHFTFIGCVLSVNMWNHLKLLKKDESCRSQGAGLGGLCLNQEDIMTGLSDKHNFAKNLPAFLSNLQSCELTDEIDWAFLQKKKFSLLLWAWSVSHL